MKRIICLGLILMSALKFSILNAQEFGFAKKMGGIFHDYGTDLCIDTLKNIYIIGYFAGNADFDPGTGSFNVQSNNNSYDIFITKLDSLGNFVWAKVIGNSGDDTGSSIEIDGNNNIIASGFFSNTVDFDPGPNLQNLTSSGQRDAFILKLDLNGNFIFVRKIGGSADENSNGLCLDESNNIYFTGRFGSTTDFDPGPGVFNLVASGNTDAYVCKLNANGDFLWAVSFGGSDNDSGRGIKYNNSEILVCGLFRNTCDFNPQSGVFNLTSNGMDDFFVLKLSNNGIFQWAVSAGSTNIDISYDVCFGNNSNILVTGFFQGDVDFDPSSNVVLKNSNGGQDVFIWELDLNGSFLSINTFGGTGPDQGWSIIQQSNGEIFLAGHFSATVNFDLGSGVYNHTSQGATDLFVCKYESDYNLLWSNKIGGSSTEGMRKMIIDEMGALYFTGHFSTVTDFDPGIGEHVLSSFGSVDIFVNKLLPCSSSISNNNSFVMATECAKMGGKVVTFDNSVNNVQILDSLIIESNLNLKYLGLSTVPDTLILNNLNSTILIENSAGLTLQNVVIQKISGDLNPIIYNSGNMELNNATLIGSPNIINFIQTSPSSFITIKNTNILKTQ